jgi:AcrR family transcriptional regulator
MTVVKRTRGGVQPVSITQEDLLDEGLRIVEAKGLDALNVAAVARGLGISSPAVYHYVRSREELIRRVCERVAEKVELPEPGGPWQDEIVAIILEMDAVFARYPGVVVRVLPYRSPSRAADGLAARVHAAIERGGLAGQEADDLHAALHFLVGGFLLGQRPNLPEGRLTPALLERSVRWLLAGAAG